MRTAAVAVAVTLAIGRIRAFVRDALGRAAVFVAIAFGTGRIRAFVRDAFHAIAAIVVAIALAAATA